jgi:hypothetical protein
MGLIVEEAHPEVNPVAGEQVALALALTRRQ